MINVNATEIIDQILCSERDTSCEHLWENIDCTVTWLIHIYILKSGQNGTWGKMEHRVFGKNHTRRGSIFKATWFLSSASSASCMEIKLAIDHVFSISQKRNFTILIYQFTRVLTSSGLINQVVEPLHVVKYNYVPLVLILHHLIEQRAIL